MSYWYTQQFYGFPSSTQLYFSFVGLPALQLVLTCKAVINLYNKTIQPIAGETAGPIGLKFLGTLMGGRGVLQAKKIRILFSIFFSTGNAGPFSQFFIKSALFVIYLVFIYYFFATVHNNFYQEMPELYIEQVDVREGVQVYDEESRVQGAVLEYEVVYRI